MKIIVKSIFFLLFITDVIFRVIFIRDSINSQPNLTLERIVQDSLFFQSKDREKGTLEVRKFFHGAETDSG